MNQDDSKFNYIIYHDNCFDGYTGFYLFIKTNLWESKPIVYPDIPHANKVPPGIENKNVIIIDVAYKPYIIQEISKLSKKMLFIDHHITLVEDVKKIILKPNDKIFYDNKYSGCLLVWKYFFGNKLPPKFVEYVNDNDIGKWSIKETLPFMAALEIHFKMIPDFNNLKKWDKLLEEKNLDKLIKKGYNYEIYKNYLLEKYSNKYKIFQFPSKKVLEVNKNFTILGQFKVAVINGGCPSVSLLGKKIAEESDCDFVLIWNYQIDKKKYVISLRSKKTDVGLIAKYFGGGGHTLASAFSINKNQFDIDDLFME